MSSAFLPWLLFNRLILSRAISVSLHIHELTPPIVLHHFASMLASPQHPLFIMDLHPLLSFVCWSQAAFHFQYHLKSFRHVAFISDSFSRNEIQRFWSIFLMRWDGERRRAARPILLIVRMLVRLSVTIDFHGPHDSASKQIDFAWILPALPWFAFLLLFLFLFLIKILRHYANIKV